MEMKLSDFFEDFLIAKEVEEGCRPSTIEAYRYDLEKFIDIVGDLPVDHKLMRQKIRLFLKRLKDKDYTKQSLSRKIACLRSFFKFLELNEYISKNPMTTIRSPKIRSEESLPKFLELKEIKRIFRDLKDKDKFNSKKSKRYYLMIRLLYSTMARVSELCSIKIKDVNFERGYIRLRGKGNKERIVPVDQKTLREIRKHLENRLVYDDDDYLLVNTRGDQLTPRVVQNDIQIIKDKCGFPDSKKLTPHVFRHTGATHLRRSGMDISELQDILGHSSPNTTRIYAKNDIATLRNSYLHQHPLSSSEEM
jgi:integrase/recombinase XerC